MAKNNNSNDICITRIYDAPVAVVWEAWTDPKQVGQWWGPRGYSITTHSHDFRPGGLWHYTMHGPDGANYINKSRYLDIEKHGKMVYDQGGNDEKTPLFRVTVLFSETKGKTTMDMRMTLATPELAAQIRTFIKKAGGDATWDRLAEYLEKQSKNRDVFVIQRSFEAPIDTLFQTWTDPDQFSKWLPPTGFEMQFKKADIRPGGRTEYSMSGPGLKMYGCANYMSIERPQRLVYTQQFCDEKGNLSRHPHAPTWPATLLTTVELVEEGPATTRVKVTWDPHGQVTAEERTTFVQSRAGMTMGWTGSFDKLETLLNPTEA